MNRKYTVGQLAEIVGGRVRGDAAVVIHGVADVSEAGPEDATWVNREKYAEKLKSSRAGAVLVPTDFGETPMPAILCEKIEPSVAKLLGTFLSPVSRPDAGIHPSAVIHPSARIGVNPSIGPHVVIDADVRVGASCIIHAGTFIGRGTTIGDDCFLWPNVVIRDGCIVGHRVNIHPNSVIGSDGFGYYFDDGRHNKVPHIGGVILEDDVEIGACTCVDRSKFGNTVVGAGTKIDNLVQVAHNARIGRHCVLTGQTGIAGSVRTGDNCVFGGRACALDNVAIGDRVTVAGLAIVDKDIPDGLMVSGFPARDHRLELRERALVRRLPKLVEQLKELIHRVEQLEASTNHNRDLELDGRGLFTGEPVSMRVRPGAANTGIWFVRTDQSPPISIAADVENVSKRSRRTSLRNGTVAIETVEHCLSACAGLHLDNLQIELNANELPGFDGSCLPFVDQLRSAGICEQDAPQVHYVVQDVVRVVEGDCELVALPPLDPTSETLEVAYDLDYGPSGPIGRQMYRVVVTPESFEANIAPARTFVLEREAAELRAAGLGNHLTHQDILVFGENGPIDNRLRFPDECVRHKILDLLGDMALLGRPIVGRIYARKSGHSLNHALVRALREQHEVRKREEFLHQRPVIGIHQLQRILPHRYPFLMIDRIIEIEGSRRVVGLKNVTINEAFFQGHYPGDPIMPGVLIIEALAQIGGVLLSQELEHKGKVAVLLSLDKVKFRRAVRPGDQLILEAEAVRVRSSTGHVKGRARVGGELVAEAEIKFILTDAEVH